MSFFNPYAIGFVCVAAGSVVGVDYMMQAKAAGSHPGAYAFDTYLGNYGLRLDDTIAFIDKTRRQSVEARMHLPQEPEGWEKHDWDIGAIDVAEVTRGMNIVQSMAAKNERRKSIARANYEAWEYRKGDQIVRISASFEEEREPSETAIAGQLTGWFYPVAEPVYSPYEVVGNVPFLSLVDAENPEAVSQTLLEARMGKEILIAVSSEAHPDDLRGLLGQIDFDSLNQMLPEPLPHVGEGAPALNESQAMILLGQQARLLNDPKSMPQEMVDAIMSGAFLGDLDEATLAQLAEDMRGEITDVDAKADEIGLAEEDSAPKAQRLQLSGGRSCLSDNAKLCN